MSNKKVDKFLVEICQLILAPLVGLEYTMVLPPRKPAASKAHRSLAFRWVRANGEHKKEATPNGVASFLRVTHQTLPKWGYELVKVLQLTHKPAAHCALSVRHIGICQAQQTLLGISCQCRKFLGRVARYMTFDQFIIRVDRLYQPFFLNLFASEI